MEIKHYETLGETVVHHQCDNGLDVYCVLKPGFNKKFVSYTTKYGSMDDHFIVNNEEVRVPDGIAHFLEHKMFEKEDGDVFQHFGKNGANANAFTTYDRTSYLFSTTTELYNNLQILMDMVENPYFTAETVEKEVGIIEEELKMYLDDPDFRSYMELLKGMYHVSPLKNDIGGSIDSIKEITHDHLYTCHATFYHPSNMVLIIVGDVDYKSVIDFVDAHQTKRGLDNNHTIERLLPTEPSEVVTPYMELTMDVSETKVTLGYKSTSGSLSPKETLKKDMTMMLALDLVFGAQSPYFYALEEKGLIDDSFSYMHAEEVDYSYSVFSVNTHQVDAFVSEINAIIDKVKHGTFFNEEMLMLKKREVIGDFLSSLNSPEYVAMQYTKFKLDGVDLFAVLEVIEDITLSDIESAFASALDSDYQVLSVVKPND